MNVILQAADNECVTLISSNLTSNQPSEEINNNNKYKQSIKKKRCQHTFVHVYQCLAFFLSVELNYLRVKVAPFLLVLQQKILHIKNK